MNARDSAGQPFAGRAFDHHPSGFAGDDGAIPPAFAQALREFHARGHSLEPVVEALRGVRLLVPLLAAAGDVGEHAGRIVEKSQELSIVAVEGPDGRPILPMFSNVDAMRSWRGDARPVPVEMQRAAAAALDDGTERVILDPGSPTELVLRRSVLVALVAGVEWVPPVRDARVVRALVAPLLAVPAALGVIATTSDPLSRLTGRELELALVLPAAGERARMQQSFEAAAAKIGAAKADWADAVEDVAFSTVFAKDAMLTRGKLRIAAPDGGAVYVPKR